MSKICWIGFILIIFQSVSFIFVTGICRNHRVNPYVLTGKQGKLYYTFTRMQEDCSWVVPPSPDNQHALIIYVKNISAKNGGSRCTGSLYLPGVEPLCKPSSVCRIYVPANSTCKISDIADKSYRSCTRNILYMNENARKEIRFHSDKKGEKSFTLMFKHVDCSRNDQRGSRILNTVSKTKLGSERHDVPEKNANTTDVSITLKTGKKTDDQDSLSSAFAVIISIVVILAILLVVACAMLYRMHKRKKKAQTFQNPAVVAYVHELPEENRNSTQRTTEYFDTASTRSHSLRDRDLYAEIEGRKNSGIIDISSIDLSEPHYQNYEVIQHQLSPESREEAACSTTDSKPKYATVNKRRDLPDVAV